jgi:molybdenum cofactor cytidylyltransferase
VKFGPLPPLEAVGGVAAHTVRVAGFVLKKGTEISTADALALTVAGVESIVVARLDPSDVGENEAASRLADLLAGRQVRVEAPFTGRSNLFSTAPGVLLIDVGAIDRANDVDESITVATLAAFKPVVAGEMIGTVKIIPYAVPGAALDGACEAAGRAAISVAPYRRKRVAVISTLLPGLKPSIVDKTLSVLAARLAPAQASIVRDLRVEHDAAALSDAFDTLTDSICDLVVVFGASAVADRRDVIPAAIEGSGGRVELFGMPVDPGNLLLLGSIRDIPVIGAPGCARSPKENGFDWVLHRLLADVPVRRADIVRMGVGGLLMEIVSRGQPRTGGEPAEEH